MSCSQFNCCKAFLFVFTIFVLLSGLLLAGLGFFLLHDPEASNVFLLLKGDTVIPQWSSYVFIGLGVAVFLFGILICCGAIYNSKVLAGTCAAFLILTCLTEVTVLILGQAVYSDLTSDEVRGDVSTRLQTQYGDTGGTFMAALDYVQYELECCGIDNKDDWVTSRWKTDQLVGQRERVPKSCCTVDKSQWFNGSRKFAEPINYLHCQAASVIDYSGYVYDKGCWDSVVERYSQQHRRFVTILLGLSMLHGVGVLLTVCFMKSLNRRQEIEGDDGRGSYELRRLEKS